MYLTIYDRVNGVLGVSRSFGDIMFKKVNETNTMTSISLSDNTVNNNSNSSSSNNDDTSIDKTISVSFDGSEVSDISNNSNIEIDIVNSQIIATPDVSIILLVTNLLLMYFNLYLFLYIYLFRYKICLYYQHMNLLYWQQMVHYAFHILYYTIQ
jgi:hypothetical protein